MKNSIIKSFIEENGEPLKSGMSGEQLVYYAKFIDLLDLAVSQGSIKQDEADNWDVRKANNLLNVLGILNDYTEADEQEDEKGDYDWFIYWR